MRLLSAAAIEEQILNFKNIKMKKKIEDYLPLYLGCRIKSKGGKFGDLVSVSTDGTSIVVYDKDKIDDPRGLCINSDWLLLVLRPLSDMKIEEGAWCLKETYFSHVDYPISDFKLEFVGQQNKNPRISIDNDWYKWDLTFGNSNGSIWNTNDTLPCNTKIKATVFTFLLSKHFDLFGLIESGLAVNAAEINSVSSR